jgi:hypothetical protein
MKQENEYYGDYAISTTDGHDIEWTFYKTREECYTSFELLKKYEDDIHVYEYKKEYGYEVVDGYWDGEL